MKKLIIFIGIVFISLPLIISCNSDSDTEATKVKSDNSVNALKRENLSSLLAEDENFITLIKVSENVINFNKDQREHFVENFNEDNILKEDSLNNAYLSSITGIDVEEITLTNETLGRATTNLLSKYPVLESIEAKELKLIIQDAINQAEESGRVVFSDKEKNCRACADEGRSDMIVDTFMGAAAGGSIGGLFGAWIGGTLGFYKAANKALVCLKKYGC